jgi:hypothetical protein
VTSLGARLCRFRAVCLAGGQWHVPSLGASRTVELHTHKLIGQICVGNAPLSRKLMWNI